MNIPDVILEIVQKGCEVTLKKIDDIVVFDIHTDAKSHLYIEVVENYTKGFNIHTRSNPTEFVDELDFHDVVWRVKNCMYGRDYVSYFWSQEIAKL